MEILNGMLLLFILVCAAAVSRTKSLLSAVIIFMAQGLAVSVVWILLRSPDLAITEAAVGAGISGTLFLMTLKKLRSEDRKDQVEEEEQTS